LRQARHRVNQSFEKTAVVAMSQSENWGYSLPLENSGNSVMRATAGTGSF